MVDAFEVPERDRYQIVTVHAPGHLVVQDTGLGIRRTPRVVVVRVVSKRRGPEKKQRLYELLAANLRARGLRPGRRHHRERGGRTGPSDTAARSS
ncbi:tautomerase family protein [Streptomyces sp. NPDC002172]